MSYQDCRTEGTLHDARHIHLVHVPGHAHVGRHMHLVANWNHAGLHGRVAHAHHIGWHTCSINQGKQMLHDLFNVSIDPWADLQCSAAQPCT